MADSDQDIERLRVAADPLPLGAEALVAYSRILTLDPSDIPAANMVGRSLEWLGRYAEARDHWARIVELQPDNPIAEGRLSQVKPLAARINDSLGATSTSTPGSSQLLPEHRKRPTQPRVNAGRGRSPRIPDVRCPVCGRTYSGSAYRGHTCASKRGR